VIAIQLVCDTCGRRTKEIVWDGAAPRGHVEALRSLDGWGRFRTSNTEAMRDWCKGCAAAFLKAERAKAKGGAK